MDVLWLGLGLVLWWAVVALALGCERLRPQGGRR